MGLAYTPGLKRKKYYIIRKVRRLPLPGTVLVNQGTKVAHNTEVARIEIPGKIEDVDAATMLDVKPEKIQKYMFKKVGDTVKKGEIIAQRKGFFGLINNICVSPTSGIIEQTPDWWPWSGAVIIREPSSPRSIYSYIPGTIVEILQNEGVIIETTGTYIQGIFGIGGETNGEIVVVVNSPHDVLTVDMIGKECKGKILVAGSMVEGNAFDKAVECGVNGIITGGGKYQDITRFLGHDIGVAITGHEEKHLTLILTEGFGQIKMAEKTFELLKNFEGRLACINGTTQIRTGVVRPEIIIPMDLTLKNEKEAIKMEALRLGHRVRIIKPPYFGALGQITKLPSERQTIETESEVRVLEVEVDSGRKIVIPRSNVELIDE